MILFSAPQCGQVVTPDPSASVTGEPSILTGTCSRWHWRHVTIRCCLSRVMILLIRVILLIVFFPFRCVPRANRRTSCTGIRACFGYLVRRVQAHEDALRRRHGLGGPASSGILERDEQVASIS